MQTTVRTSILLSLPILALALASCGRPNAGSHSAPQEAWNEENDPVQFAPDYETRLSDLPRAGRADVEPWTDNYWPSHRGGLAERWNDAERPDPFRYEPPTESEVRAMSPGELARLSPAEKYDILIGNFDYDLLQYERSRTSPDDETWFGLCHGWAAAAVNFPEPSAARVRGPSGIEVPFGSSDVKALLTFVQQYDRGGDAVRFLGGRCNRSVPGADVRPTDVECRDANAGAFHVIMANEVGLRRNAIIADTTRDREVWNYPVHGYQSRVLAESTAIPVVAAPGTTRIVDVETTIVYTGGGQALWDAQAGAGTRREVYRYGLELDASGRIIGGEWRTTSRPDFLWTQSTPKFEGYFAELETILSEATR